MKELLTKAQLEMIVVPQEVMMNIENPVPKPTLLRKTFESRMNLV